MYWNAQGISYCEPRPLTYHLYHPAACTYYHLLLRLLQDYNRLMYCKATIRLLLPAVSVYLNRIWDLCMHHKIQLFPSDFLCQRSLRNICELLRNKLPWFVFSLWFYCSYEAIYIEGS